MAFFDGLISVLCWWYRKLAVVFFCRFWGELIAFVMVFIGAVSGFMKHLSLVLVLVVA